MYHARLKRRAFTLIELLVVIAIVAVLAVTVILTLNPADLLKQARDSNRFSDLVSLNTALGTYTADISAPSMGSTTVVYVSIPDSSSSCANLNLPALRTGYTYGCATSAAYRNTDGTGWIPVNFNAISSGSPLSTLPIDPVNTTSTGKYYVYVASGGTWEVNGFVESTKYRTAQSSKQNFPGVISKGSNLGLSPLTTSTGMIGYWPLDEGSGTAAADLSGTGNNLSLVGGLGWVSGSNCRVGTCLNFTSTQYASSTANLLSWPTTDMTMSTWVNRNQASYSALMSTNASNFTVNNALQPAIRVPGGTMTSATAITNQTYYLLTTTRAGDGFKVYINGTQVVSSTASNATLHTGIRLGYDNISGLGGGDGLNGQLDEVRLYNRALSAAEVMALYSAQR